MDRITQLNNEAVRLGLFLIAGDFNIVQGFVAKDRIQEICNEIGGTHRELILNCEQILAGHRVNPLTD